MHINKKTTKADLCKIVDQLINKVDELTDIINSKEKTIKDRDGHIEYLQNELAEREGTIRGLKGSQYTEIQGLKAKIKLHQKATDYADLRAAAFLEVIRCLHEH